MSSEAIRCPDGHEVREGVQFCTVCGKALDASPGAWEADASVGLADAAPSLAAPPTAPGGDTDEGQPDPLVRATASDPNHRSRVAVIACLVVVVLGALAFVVVSSSGDSASSTEGDTTDDAAESDDDLLVEWKWDGGQDALVPILDVLTDLRAVDGSTPNDQILDMCIELVGYVQQAPDAGPIPVSSVNADYQSALDNLLDGGRGCVGSLSDYPYNFDPDTFSSALQQISDGQDQIYRAVEAINDADGN